MKPIPTASMFDRLKNPIRYSVNPVGVLADTAQRYGDLVRFMPPRSPFDTLMLNRAEWIEDVIERHAWNFSIVRVLSIDKALNQGLLTSRGYLHKQQRELMAEPFHAWVPSATAMIARRGDRLRESWRDGTELDMRAEMLRLTARVSAEVAFGADGTNESEQLQEAGVTACRYLSRPSTHPLGSFLEAAPIQRDNRDFWAAMRLLDTAIYRRIDERRAHGGDEGDLLSLLLNLRDPQTGDRMSDRQVRDEIITLYTAGAAPMAWALARAWYLLSQHPEAEAQLHAELDDVLAGRLPVADDLPRLAYTRMVLQETLRLYPSAWVFARNVLNDYQLDRYMLPAGSIVVFSSYVTQRDARYFPDPTRFDPERWTADEVARRPRFSYFPWGGGPRSCFGEPLAMLAMTTLLATLASEWQPRSVSAEPDAFYARFTLGLKQPMLMRLERRSAERAQHRSDPVEQASPVASRNTC